MKTKDKTFSELAWQVFPEELAEFYEKNISLFALLRKIRKVNESMAFDIWRYLLRRADTKGSKRRFERSLVDAYEFRFDESLDAIYLSALQRDECFREVLFKKVSVINERQVWLLFLALKYDEGDLFCECMRLFRRNINRFQRSSSYSLDVLLLRLIDRLYGRADATYMSKENYAQIIWFAEMVALPWKRRRIYNAAKRAMQFHYNQGLEDEERQRVIHEKVLRMARQAKERRIRERDVKYPLWEDGHTVVPYRIAGLRYYLSSEQIEELLPQGTLLRLTHEKDNKFDLVAVTVSLMDGTKVGYIEKPYNRAFCDLLCSGEGLLALVTEVEQDIIGFFTVWITIAKEKP